MARRQSLWAVALGWLSFAIILAQCRSLHNNQVPLGGGGSGDNSRAAPHERRPSAGQASPSLRAGPRNATVKLYPGSRDSSNRGGGAGCSATSPAETLSLAPGVCLSGDYYLDANVELLQAPACEDGNPAYMAVFRRRGCTGSRTWLDYGRAGLPACLDTKAWPLRKGSGRDVSTGQSSWSHWSVMFYCGHLESALQADGADEHLPARPPSAGPTAVMANKLNRQREGRLEVFASEAQCRQEGGQIAKDESLEPGTYLNLPAYIDVGTGFVKVAKPAFCADGTRARLTLYKNVDCASHYHSGGGDHDVKVLDVTDDEMHRCVDVKDYKAVAFSCGSDGHLPAARGLVGLGVGGGRRSWLTSIMIAALAIMALCVVVAIVALGVGEILRLLALMLRRFGIRVELKKPEKRS